MTSVTRSKALISVSLVLALVALAGCSKKSTTASTPASTASASASGSDLSSKLPPDIKAAGVIKVASDVSYAPIEFFMGGTKQVAGVDYDLGQALGAKLGVTFTFTDQKFATIIPALQAHKFDIIMSAMTDNKDRQKTLDFVDYFTAGTSILVKKGNPEHITKLTDLCGKTVGMEQGTVQVDFIKAHQKDCTAAGKPAITLKPLPKDTDALLAVKSGGAVADINDAPVAAYNAKVSNNGNDFEVVIDPSATGGYEAGPYGIGILKGNQALVDAIQAALQAIIADGTYDKIMNTWGTTANALKTATVNGGS